MYAVFLIKEEALYNREDLYRAWWTGQRYVGPKDQEIRLQVDPLGDLAVVEGELVFADPYAINLGLDMQADGIATGTYPAELYSELQVPHGDRLHLGAGIRFTDQEAASFRMVLPRGVREEDLAPGSFMGLATESGNVSLLAKKTCAWLLENREGAGQVLEAIEADISATYFDLGGMANIKLPNMEANIITVVARGEAGVYPAYWVYAEDETLCGLLVDFTAPQSPTQA